VLSALPPSEGFFGGCWSRKVFFLVVKTTTKKTRVFFVVVKNGFFCGCEFTTRKETIYNHKKKQPPPHKEFSRPSSSLNASCYILAEGAIALSVTLSGGALFASGKLLLLPSSLTVKVILAIFMRALAQHCTNLLQLSRRVSCRRCGSDAKQPPQRQP